MPLHRRCLSQCALANSRWLPHLPLLEASAQCTLTEDARHCAICRCHDSLLPTLAHATRHLAVAFREDGALRCRSLPAVQNLALLAVFLDGQATATGLWGPISNPGMLEAGSLVKLVSQ